MNTWNINEQTVGISSLCPPGRRQNILKFHISWVYSPLLLHFSFTAQFLQSKPHKYQHYRINYS